jgi:hypothetical protein
MADSAISRHIAVVRGISQRFTQVLHRRVSYCGRRMPAYGNLASGGLTAALEGLVQTADIKGDHAAFDKAIR